MGSSQDAWQEMERGTCPVCNKVKRVCCEDGCNGDEKVVENTTYLLDDYPAIVAYSLNKLSSDNPNRVADVATVAKNATLDDKCVKIERLKRCRDKRQFKQATQQKINELVNTVNELTKMCQDLSKEQSK